MAKADALRIIRENIEKHKRGEDARVLDLGNCGLTEFPEEALECVWVEELILSGKWGEYDFENKKWEQKNSQNRGNANEINLLPPTLPKLHLLQKLVAASMQIADLEPLGALANLQQLYCYSTKITDLSPLAALTDLQQLSCSSTKIADLSPLAALTNLQQLSCSSTKIADLSPLAALTNLQLLSCSSKQITDLSPLAALTNLKLLYCYSTKITDLSPLAALSNLQLLYCYFTQIADLSPLASLINLQQLSCSSTQVADLSPLASLINLQQLYCSSTPVADLSPLALLTNLHHLDCSSTPVADLSPLASLTNLQHLSCSSTQVADLSPLETLTNLQKFYCSSTPVADLSPFASLTNLQHLDCSSTKIADLSPLETLTNLQHLSCSYTQVADLSPILTFIKKEIQVKWESYGSGILVKDCPLINPPIEIVKQGNEAILNYFREKELTGVEKSLEAKVVLIGEGQAGKTSLRTRLLRPEAPLPNKADRTKGLDIEIEKYVYELAGGERMRLNVFDFGGQDHYKPLHQFFYSKNTLYVLVTKNGDDATNDFDFWLDTAKLFGQGSPVLLVHNLFGDVRSQFNRSKYARFEDILKESIEVNLLTLTGWEAVKSHVEFLASRLPHVHEEIPKSWGNVRRTLAARREEQVISMKEFLKICAEPDNGSMDRERALRCSAYLHDIGIILHYQDNLTLEPHVIIKNEWATEAVYRVIDDREIDRRSGLFGPKDLVRIWYQPEYENLRSQLLELMKKFRLCYPLKNSDDLIAPQLLPVRPPEGYIWQPKEDLQLFVEYDFMPLGLMSQLIVECHLLIAEERRLVWRDGFVAELPDNQARAEILLQKRNGKQAIGIRVQGSKRRDLMTIIDSKLEELHHPFGSGLNVEKKIPCVCTRCAATENKWFFNLSELENRKNAGKPMKECEFKPFEAVSIERLLGNVFSKNIPNHVLEPMENEHKPPKIFISYSKHDLAHKDTLLKHLSGLRGKIATWHDRDILGGEDWDQSIKTALLEADVVLYLVTKHSLATDYIQQVELPLIQQRCEEGECRLIPIIVDYCDWTELEFARFNALPEKDIPIKAKKWETEDQAWLKVVEGLKAVLKQ